MRVEGDGGLHPVVVDGALGSGIQGRDTVIAPPLGGYTCSANGVP